MAVTFMEQFLIKLSVKLTMGVLNSLTKRLQEAIMGTPAEKAVERSLQAGLGVFVDFATKVDNKVEKKHIQDIFEKFFNHDDVRAELAGMLRGKDLDMVELAFLFTKAGYDAETMPDLDFEDGMKKFQEAFLEATRQEESLQGLIQTDHIVKLTRIQQEMLHEVKDERSDKIKPQNALDIYLDNIADKYRYMPMRGIDKRSADPSDDKEQMNLVQVYVKLNTKSQVKVKQKKRENKTRPLSALEAAVENKNLVILGDPGSGKSTFVNHLCFCVAKRNFDNIAHWPESKKEIIPIPIVLRDFAVSIKELAGRSVLAKPNHLWDFIATWLKEQNMEDVKDTLKKALFDGRALVLMDGLDEIPTKDQRVFVRDAVFEFAKSYKKSHFLVTCRVLSYEDKKVQIKSFVAHELDSFNEEQIKSFIHSW